MSIKTTVYYREWITENPLHQVYEVLLIKDKIQFEKRTEFDGPTTFPDINKRLSYDLNILDKHDKDYIEGYNIELTIKLENRDYKIYLNLSTEQKIDLALMRARVSITKDFKFWIPAIISAIALIISILALFVAYQRLNTTQSTTIEPSNVITLDTSIPKSSLPQLDNECFLIHI